MASRTITAVFDTKAEATRAQEALAAHGIARSDINVHRMEGSGTTASSANTDKGFWESLGDMFMPEEDRHTYYEAGRRGAHVLSVRLADHRMEEAADILEANGAVDLDEREAAWRSEGWSGRSDYVSDAPDGTPGNPPGTMLSRGTDEVLGTNISGARPENESAARTANVVDSSINGAPRPRADINDAGAMGSSGAYSDRAEALGRGQNPNDPPGTMLSRGTDDVLGTNISGARPENETGVTGTGMTGAGMTGAGMTGARGLHGEREESIPIVEERLRVGKRETGHGRVRIRSYVVEEPVEEQVTLRSERVELDRRPADRAVNPGENLFQERTIEATESQEEAVISKEARVTGEVGIRKEGDSRTETVRDTVRRTEVEVERDGKVERERDM